MTAPAHSTRAGRLQTALPNPVDPLHTPLVSVMMPVYNGAAYVALAVNSILAQTYGNWELIVIDDGSTDGTARAMRSFDDPRIHLVVSERNRGLPNRLNQAMDLAKGDLLARMDADDIAYPERFARQVAFLQQNPSVDVVATDTLVIDLEGRPSGQEKHRGDRHEDIVSRPWAGFHFNHPTWMGRTTWFRRFRYLESAVRTEDDDLMLRSFRTSRFHRLPDVLQAYRVGPLSSRAAWVARSHYMRSLWRETLIHRDPRLLIGIGSQLAKAAAERLAERLHVRHLVTRHRADGTVAADLTAQYGSVLERIRNANGA